MMKGAVTLFMLLYIASRSAGEDSSARKPPKILNGDEILAAGSVDLQCVGTQPLYWTFKDLKQNYSLSDESEKASTTLEGYTDASKLSLQEEIGDEQGEYFCHYEGADLEDSSRSYSTYIYLFANNDHFADVGHDPIVTNKLHKVSIGESYTIDCRPSNPNTSVTVTLNGSKVHDGPLEEPRIGYIIENMTSEKNGKYECAIDNIDKIFNVEAKAELQKPMVKISPNTYAVVGYEMVLECKILDREYSDEPKFSWTCPHEDTCIVDSSRKPFHDETKKIYTSFLTVPKVALIDSGIYTCTVTVTENLPTRQTYNITVEENKKPFLNVTQKEKEITCDVGENITWTLDVKSFPPNPEFKYDNNRFKLLFEKNGTTTLTMTNVQPSYFNVYSLVITTNNHTSQNVTLMLKVNSGPRMEDIGGVSDTVLQNSTVVATCNVSGYPLDDIKWYYKSCPRGQCNGDNKELQNDSVTDVDNKENIKRSRYTFVATELAKVYCQSGNARKNIHIAVADIEKKYSFKYSRDGKWQDVPLDGKTQAVIEWYPFSLTCAASKFYFDNLTLEFSSADNQEGSRNDISPIIEESTRFTIIKKFVVANVSKHDSGKYECKAEQKDHEPYNSNQHLSLTVNDLIKVFLTNGSNMKSGGVIVTKDAKESFTFKCLVNGTPEINITWMKDGKPLPATFEKPTEGNQIIKISDLNIEKHKGHYECKAMNKGGIVKSSLTLHVEAEVISKGAKIILWIVIVGIIILIVIVMWLTRRVRKDFLQRRETKKNMDFLFERGRPNELNPDCTADEQAELLPYDRKWEIPRDSILIGQQLGAGAFGRVVKAEVSNLEPGVPKTIAALKMCKAQADASQVRALTLELKIMLHLGKHLNIVNLLGAHTSRVNKGELWILVEYCRYGSLLSFLHRHRQNFVNVIDPMTGTINLSNTVGTNMSPFSPIPVTSSRLSKPSTSPTSKSPASPTDSELEAYVSGHTASSGKSSGGARLLPETPQSPTIQESGDVQEGRQPSPPRVFNFESPSTLAESLTKGMTMVHNPAYSMVPISEDVSSPVVEDSRGSTKRDTFRRKRSLVAQDSHGNFFMYDKSSIPGVTSTFTTVDLLCWAWQVAEGMDYLTRRKVLHGDLALRNLLLAQDNVVKISDFGLSRDVYRSDVYIKQTNDLMPVKWMSIEAIRDRIFTVQSDVWAFGVTLWELFTLGSTPYPGVKMDHTFLQNLEEGYRMEMPKHSSKDIYTLISACWFDHPDDRPDFRTLANNLSQMLMPETTKHYNEKNDEYLNCNVERFKNEPDYLEMLSAPDFKHICNKDDVSREEEEPRNDAYLNMNSPTSSPNPNSQDEASSNSNLKKIIIPNDDAGYLPMISAGSPTPSFSVFSPTKTSDDQVFRFTRDNIPQGEIVNKVNGSPCQDTAKRLTNEGHDSSSTRPSSTLTDHKDEGNGNHLNPAPENNYLNLSKDFTSPLINEDDKKHHHPSKDHQELSVQDGNYVNIPSLSPEAISPSPSSTFDKTDNSSNSSYMNLQTVK